MILFRFQVLISCLLFFFLAYTAESASRGSRDKKIIEIPGMVWIPAGEFIFGSDEGFSYESPQRKVYVDGFYIDKYEVTNIQYKRFIDSTGHRPPPHWIDGNYPENQDEFPVVNVSYYDALLYAKWAGKRLPTEIEWEKAARGTDGRRFPWGDSWQNNSANISFWLGIGWLKKVGTFPEGKSPYGCFDMVGNVKELTDSFFQPYPGSLAKNEKFGKKYIVVRGSSYKSSKSLSFVYRRDIIAPDKYRSDVGFRCAK